MIKESFIYNFFIKIYSIFINIYINSKTYEFFKYLGNLALKIWNGSLLKDLMYKNFGTDTILKNSVLGKVLTSFGSAIVSKTTKLKSIVNKSFIVSSFKIYLDNLLFIKIRSFSYIFFSFALFNIVFSFIFTKNLYKETILISSIFIFLGAFCFLIKNSFNTLLKTSFISNIVINYIGVKTKDQSSTVNPNLVFLVLGGTIALLLNTLDIINFILIFGGVTFLILSLYSITFSVYILVFFLPLLPTKFIVGILAVLLLSFFVKVFITGSIKVNFSLLDLFVFLFLCVVLYSVIISYIPSKSLFTAFLYTLFIGAYFTIKSVITTKEKLFTLVSVILISAFFVGIIGILQRHTSLGVSTSAWVDSEMFEDLGTRVYSTLDNPNVLGEFLIITIPIAFASLYYYKGILNKFISLVILGVLCITILYTGSRGAWLGVIVALGIFAFLYDIRLVYLGLLALPFVPFILPESILNRFLSIGNVGDTSTSYRVSIWQGSYSLVKDYWLIGIGLSPTVFIYVYQKYAFSASYAQHSHHLFLQIIAELGIVGFVLFTFMILAFYKNILNNIPYERNKFLKVFNIALVCGMTGYLIQGLTDNSWYNYRIVMYFFLLLALSSAYKNIKGCIEND